MSKVLYVCSRKPFTGSKIEAKVQRICEDLNAGNLESKPSILYHEKNIVYGISNPTSTIRTKGLNVLLGKIFGEETKWFDLLAESPDGNFVILRSNDNNVELVTDYLGTRSIWYYFDEEIFIGSTSQKAIIQYLESFEFQDRIIPWMLSTAL
ncbi:hypothetical protein LZ575_00455 [Antarcticibacterium sp. 1MA-6-2]|uniref:hypothetical protein n=1 Tax=Antarcticibacterium sp. 1MA-6-2 TaxID=2908210 RepID=UPI001F243347|nr:hypothetical protein [Antarcticibacterium sp. 1MA-6-2]UJH91311.1 hypothetical protein LZ575_00455 [Antarcticibacterium sp. 1MA-6-2]